MLEAQRAAFFAELPVPLAIRRDRLRRAVTMIEQNSAALCAALASDQANQDAESAMVTEVAPALAALRDSLDGVASWLRPAGGRNLFARLGQGDDYVDYQPIGVVGIAAPAALPLLRTVSILASALAAGNRVMIQFDAGSSHLAGLFAGLAPDYFDPLELATIPGGPDGRAAFTNLAFDLLVTSDAHAAEGEGAVPEPMEIARSGKSPVILGRSADFAKAAERVVASKRFKGGRAPLAPDYLLVPEEQEEAIAAWLWRAAMRPGADDAQPLTDAEQARLTRLLDDARARGGEVLVAEPRGGGMPLHIVRHASEDMLVMREEIGGPILPLRNYAQIDDAIAAIHRREPPLAIYYFGRDGAERRHVLARTISSAIALDGRALAVARKLFPQAGTGMTLNIGHGEVGFHRFSRARHVYRQPLLDLLRPSLRGGGPAPALQ